MIRSTFLAAGVLALAATAFAASKPSPAAAAAPAVAAAAPGDPTAADWRTPDPENVMVIDTTKGRIFVELYPEVAPTSLTSRPNSPSAAAGRRPSSRCRTRPSRKWVSSAPCR